MRGKTRAFGIYTHTFFSYFKMITVIDFSFNTFFLECPQTILTIIFILKITIMLSSKV